MKNGNLYVVVQPGTSNYYWAKNIFGGMRQAASEWQDNLNFYDYENIGIENELSGKYILIVGNDSHWLEPAIRHAIECNAHPIIVNASMVPLERFRCSGVVFELEEAVKNCAALFGVCGRRKTALLGLNPNSVTDSVKAKAFGNTKDVKFVLQSIEECVEKFIDELPQSRYDSVICSNDTVAICLVKQMLKKGFSLPQDLYIAGMGNSYVGSGLSVPLTSIAFDYRKMGEMAIRLYHNLRTSYFPCHMVASLPCDIVIRPSAPLDINKAPLPMTIPQQPSNIGYFAGDTVNGIIRTEAMFQESDDIDREILFGIAKDEDCDTIAERIFLSGRAVRYRLAKIVKKYGFKDRNELKKSIKSVINQESGEV